MAEQEKRRTGRSTHGMSIEELVKTYYGVKEPLCKVTPEEVKAAMRFLEEQRERDRAKRNTGK